MRITINEGDQLDDILKANRWPGTEFVLSPGNHWTEGHTAFSEFDFCMIPAGCQLTGSGVGKTVVRLSSSATDYREVLTGGMRTARLGQGDGMRVSDLTIDCRQQSARTGPTIGLHLWATGATVERVQVLGVVGDRIWKTPNEGFGILINNAGAHEGSADQDGGHSVRDCSVEAAGYSTACYVGCPRRQGRAMMRSQVERVSCISSNGNTAHAAFAFNGDTSLNRCHATRFVRGVFVDTDSVHAARIDRCSFQSIQWGLEVRTPLDGAVVEEVLVVDSAFEFDPTEWGQIVLAVNPRSEGGRIEGLRFRQCSFRQNGTRASRGRCEGPGVETPAFRDCDLIGPWQPIIVQP